MEVYTDLCCEEWGKSRTEVNSAKCNYCPFCGAAKVSRKATLSEIRFFIGGKFNSLVTMMERMDKNSKVDPSLADSDHRKRRIQTHLRKKAKYRRWIDTVKALEETEQDK